MTRHSQWYICPFATTEVLLSNQTSWESYLSTRSVGSLLVRVCVSFECIVDYYASYFLLMPNQGGGWWLYAFMHRSRAEMCGCGKGESQTQRPKRTEIDLTARRSRRCAQPQPQTTGEKNNRTAIEAATTIPCATSNIFSPKRLATTVASVCAFLSLAFANCHSRASTSSVLWRCASLSLSLHLTRGRPVATSMLAGSPLANAAMLSAHMSTTPEGSKHIGEPVR